MKNFMPVNLKIQITGTKSYKTNTRIESLNCFITIEEIGLVI